MVAASSSVPAARGPGVYGSYVDEVLGYRQTVGGVASVYYPHGNHLYSVAALTNAAGQVVERYSYTAYGKQTITGPTGVVRQVSAVGFDRGFTGYIADNETGLDYARSRMYSPTLGRFAGRDPQRKDEEGPNSLDGYIDGMGLYQAYFVPNKLDSTGKWGDDGHNSMPNLEGNPFDWTAEDHDWRTAPDTGWYVGSFFITAVTFGNYGFNRHFRSPGDILDDLLKDVKECDRDSFERHMHQYQDTYVHYNPGWRTWQLGHAFGGTSPDDMATHRRQLLGAQMFTARWLKVWCANCEKCKPCRIVGTPSP